MQLIITLIACFFSSALAVEIGAEGIFGDLEDALLGGSNDCNCGHNYLSEYQAEQAKTSSL